MGMLFSGLLLGIPLAFAIWDKSQTGRSTSTSAFGRAPARPHPEGPFVDDGPSIDAPLIRPGIEQRPV